jgi:hypothetical protein
MFPPKLSSHTVAATSDQAAWHAAETADLLRRLDRAVDADDAWAHLDESELDEDLGENPY